MRALLRGRVHGHFHGRLAGLLKNHAMKLEVNFCDKHFCVDHRATSLIRVAELEPKGVFAVDSFLTNHGHFDGAFLLVAFRFIDGATSNYGLKNVGDGRLFEKVHAHLSTGSGSDCQAQARSQ
jgi:hypothetical protein